MKKIPVYKFFKHKYGDELLVDIVDYDDMRGIHETPVFTETFYSITLVKEGNEHIGVNGQYSDITHATVITSIPGEVWSFPENVSLKALNLVFEKEFLLSFFNDSHFLDQFEYLSADRHSPFLHLSDNLYQRIHTLYKEMQEEIIGRKEKDQHILRAMLYETLMLLNRADINTNTTEKNKSEMPASRYVEQFVKLVDDNFATQHGTEFYAGKLCITSNYLNKIIHRALGKSVKTYIEDRIMRDACRQLRYTMLSVQEISEWLGYESATYFVRTFRKHIGMTPLEYRKRETE